jgi:DNA-directed RNA polymerase sigma subunit (sigma70/sigma32)
MANNEPAQLHGAIDMTFGEIGAALDITEHRARMDYASAMRKIRLHHGPRLAQMRELARGKHTRYSIIAP